MMSPTSLPRVLRRATSDNLVLAPASLLPFKDQWQQLADELPAGSTLIILPAPGGPRNDVLERIAASFEAMGRTVKVLAASEIPEGRAYPLLVS